MNKVLSHVRRCVEDYDMIQSGDRVAVGVSGGKDSLTLLAALAKLREFYPKPFTVEAITLDMGHADGRESADFSRVADLCARLKARGYVLALASSKPESLCVPICEKFGFTPSLAVVTGSPPVGDWSKADVIRETMRRLELTEAHKPEILMVGDRKFDVLGAKACGIACAGVEFFGYAAPGELAESGAVAVVRTPEELEQFILTH